MVTKTITKSKNVATFEYRDVDNNTRYIKERHEPARNGGNKEFFFKHKNADGIWVNGKGDCKSVLYNLPEVANAKNVIFVEGEGLVEFLMEQGITATCLDTGSNSPWIDEYSPYIEGKEEIIILPDNDKAGMGYALKIANAIHSKVGIVKIVELPGLDDKGDIVDWAKIPLCL